MQTRTLLRLGMVTSCAAVLRLGIGVAAAEPVFEVDSTADLVDDDVGDGICHTTAGTCTLRAAIMESNVAAANGSESTIDVPAGVYDLTRAVVGSDGDDEGDLNLTAAASDELTTIRGAGAQATIIDANHLDRVFSIAANRDVAISAITMRNGETAANGGCIENEGTLAVSDSVIDACTASLYGGGVYSGPQAGKAVFTLTHSTVSSNRAYIGGGFVNTGAAHITNSTIIGNAAVGEQANGGGVVNSSATLEIVDSTIASNSAAAGGGLLAVGGGSDGTIVATNSTIAGNAANFGGGVYFTGGVVVLFNASIVANLSPREQTDTFGAAGIYAEPAGGSNIFELYNSLVAGNLNQIDFDTEYDCEGPISVTQNNLIGTVASCGDHGCLPTGIEGCTISQTDSGHLDLLNSTRYLDGLADNGGLTPTVALLPGSNAIDYGPSEGCADGFGSTLSTDQRGIARPGGATCDVGAYEFNDTIFRGGFEQ